MMSKIMDGLWNAAYFGMLLSIGLLIAGPNMLLDQWFGTVWVLVLSGLLILGACGALLWQRLRTDGGVFET